MNNAARRQALAADGNRIAAFRSARDARNAAEAAKAIQERKAEAKRLIAKLQAQLNAIPDAGNWANAGDAGHIVEQLQYLTHERG